MGLISVWNALLKADATQWSQGFKQARAEVDKTQAKTQGFFKSLKADFGKGSLLGQSLKLAAGGGAIAGLSLAAKDFEMLSGKIAEMSDAYRKGDVSGKEMIGNILREVPILGSVTKGFDALREAITGEGVAIEKQNELAKVSEQQWADHKKRLDENKKATMEWGKEIDDLLQKLRLAGTPTGERGKVAAQMGMEEQLGKAKEDYMGSLDSGALSKRKELDFAKDVMKELMKMPNTQGARDKQIAKIAALQPVVKDAEDKALAAKAAYERKRQLITDTAAAEEHSQLMESTEKMMGDRRQKEEEGADAILEDRKKQRDTMKKTELEMMENRKDQLEEITGMAHEHAHQGSAMTSEFRGGAMTVQMSPAVGKTPQQKAAEDAVTELKELNKTIKTLRRQDDEPSVSLPLS